MQKSGARIKPYLRISSTFGTWAWRHAFPLLCCVRCPILASGLLTPNS